MLRDHEPQDWKTDQFKLSSDKEYNPRFEANLCFPCCCCEHSSSSPQDAPCSYCGHNSNASCYDLGPVRKDPVVKEKPWYPKNSFHHFKRPVCGTACPICRGFGIEEKDNQERPCPKCYPGPRHDLEAIPAIPNPVSRSRKLLTENEYQILNLEKTEYQIRNLARALEGAMHRMETIRETNPEIALDRDIELCRMWLPSEDGPSCASMKRITEHTP